MEDKATIVDRIRILANSRGLSLTSLEVALKLGNGTISRWNKSSPNSDKLTRVADYFHVPVDYLLGRDKSYHNYEFAKELDLLTKPVSIDDSATHWPIKTLSEADFAAISLAQNGYTILPVNSTEKDFLTKFRMLDQRGQAAVLNVLNHEYESLPGEKTNPSAKNA